MSELKDQLMRLTIGHGAYLLLAGQTTGDKSAIYRGKSDIVFNSIKLLIDGIEDKPVEPVAIATGAIDANDLERLAKERPDECFLRGTGILKLTGAIRTLERENRELKAKLASAQNIGNSFKTNTDEMNDIVSAGLENLNEDDALELLIEMDYLNNGGVRNAALEEAAIECDRQGYEETDCPERAAYCAEAIRQMKSTSE